MTPTASRRALFLALFLCGSLTWAAPAWSGTEIGQPAPDFSLADTRGSVHQLSDARGSFVVLEWYNPDCPFVKKHYGSGNLPRLQRDFASRGVVWFVINSSAPGEQGHYPPEEYEDMLASHHAAPAAMLLDHDGTAGLRYGAKTTPHLFIVDPEGTLIYAGGIDDRPSADPADIPDAENYVARALGEALEGRAVTLSRTQPYGCSVKYAD
ncbi:MAG TPA: thioredoxin family protein [bacterium]